MLTPRAATAIQLALDQHITDPRTKLYAYHLLAIAHQIGAVTLELEQCRRAYQHRTAVLAQTPRADAPEDVVANALKRGIL